MTFELHKSELVPVAYNGNLKNVINLVKSGILARDIDPDLLYTFVNERLAITHRWEVKETGDTNSVTFKCLCGGNIEFWFWANALYYFENDIYDKINHIPICKYNGLTEDEIIVKDIIK